MRRAAVLVAVALAAPAGAQTSFPMITHVSPVAVQRGTTAKVGVEGQMNFQGAYKTLFAGGGVTAEVVPNPAPKAAAKPVVKSVTLKVTVAPDAPLGVREFRLATTLGIS